MSGSSSKPRYSKEVFNDIRQLMHCATKMELSAVTTATACVFFHRFCRECARLRGERPKSSSVSFPSDYDAPLIAATCIYLAGKATEEHVKLRDIVNVSYRTVHEDKPPLQVGEKYWQFREAVVRCELFLIRMLGFNLRAELPHTFLAYHLRSLTDWIFANVDRKDHDASMEADARQAALTNTCWSILRDCYHTPSICLDVDPSHLSICVIYLGLECYGIEVPLNRVDGTPWYSALSDDLTLDDIEDTVTDIIELYELELHCS